MAALSQHHFISWMLIVLGARNQNKTLSEQKLLNSDPLFFSLSFELTPFLFNSLENIKFLVFFEHYNIL